MADHAHSILLVMDMINDLVHEEGPNAQKPMGLEAQRRDVVARTALVLDKARRSGLAVGFVRIGFSPDYKECPMQSPRFGPASKAGLFKLGTWGTEVHPKLAPLDGEHDIVKHRVSPFYGTSLEPILRARGLSRLYLTGVSTNGVVQGAMREGHDRDYECILIEDCCSAASAEEHEAAVRLVAGFGRVITSAEVDF